MSSLWPVDLPQIPLANGYSSQKRTNNIRSSMGYGNDKIRRRSSAIMYDVAMVIYLTEAQLASFNAFFTNSLIDGSLPFEWIHHVDGTTVDYRFMSPAVFSKIAPDVWSATMSLEIVP